MPIWHVNTTARGGGVAEILNALVRHSKNSEFEHRRFVTDSDPVVFNATKRLHHRIHGVDRGGLPDPDEHTAYLAFAARNAARLLELLRDGDTVMLHDPQTLPMASLLVRRGIPVLWRCHIGTAVPHPVSSDTWDYLSAFWPSELGLVFSVPELIPAQATGRPVATIAPSIDPDAPKNRPMSASEISEILAWAGLGDGPGGPRRAGFEAFSDGPVDDDPVLLQVSRWDPLKDMAGVLRAFVRSALPDHAQLVLCGPSPSGVADDPEAGAVLDEVIALRHGLPPRLRRRVHLLCTPLADDLGNSLLVNALQRRADIVVQRSVQEGFGLTVTEAMFKARPVVASAVGGIPRQITSGQTGLLLKNPGDDEEFTGLVGSLLQDRETAARLGRAARETARAEFTVEREAADHDRTVRAFHATL
ncbi:glycosyltransferase [Streptomyces sp. NPDC020472]|uniref:glycosyltransferase n=1 Tax=Streptomyces sp. NPDC020472 TaxID=3365075 RepID=UPI0037B91BC1